MLQAKGLTITHRRDGRVLISDFNFTLNPGDRAVIVGEEGDGKSTLLKALHNPALIADYADCTGEIVRAGTRTGYLAQETPAEEKPRAVYDLFAQGPLFEAPPALAAQTARTLALPADVFYSPRPLGGFSGGEQVKLRLARVLLEQPDALLLDEPSNDLDLAMLEELETFLNTCGLPVLFVSHDETLIERTANAVVHLEQVRRKTVPRCTVARLPYRQYVEERQAAFAHQTQVARKEQGDYARQMERYRQIYARVEHDQNAVSRGDPAGGRLLKKKMHAVQSMGRRLEREHESAAQLPDTEDSILVRFPEDIAVPRGKTVLELSLGVLRAGNRELARNLRLHVEGPEKLCITGSNGAGKSTLLREIAAVLLPRTDIRAAYLPQDYAELLGAGGTPVEFLSQKGDKEELTRIRTFLGSMKYTPGEMEHPVEGLSGGQRAKLCFLRMIFAGCNVLLLDEPTRNFSPLSGPVVRDVLRNFGGAVIAVSHDRKFLAEVCTRELRLTPKGLIPA